MTTSEVAAYLRLKQRKVYDLVRERQIPSTRVTGKLLFPRPAIDLWLMNHLEGDEALGHRAPAVYAGSSDPLLDWALREAHTELAQLCGGSSDGVQRLLNGDAQVIGLHVIEPDSGHYNDPARCGLGGLRDLVMIEWARRVQGLVVSAGNPKGIGRLADLLDGGLRVAHRQPAAGAATLFSYLLRQAGVDIDRLQFSERVALTEDDLAIEVTTGHADCGLAVEAAARRHGLDFMPLFEERFDLALRRRSYFEAPVQRLMAFVRSDRFQNQAADMGGYRVERCGEVVFNA